MRRALLHLFLVVSFGVSTSCVSSEEDADSLGTVPLLMYDEMQRIECAPIGAFYSSVEVIEPPFVWIDRRSFAFVCEKPHDSVSRDYVLVVKSGEKQHAFSSCCEVIDLAERPGGLVFEIRNVVSADFVSVQGRTPLYGTTHQAMPLLTVSIGTGGFIGFACVNGEWFFNTYS